MSNKPIPVVIANASARRNYPLKAPLNITEKLLCGSTTTKKFTDDSQRNSDAANYQVARKLLCDASTTLSALLNARAAGEYTQRAIETFLSNTKPKIRGNSRKNPTSPSV